MCYMTIILKVVMVLVMIQAFSAVIVVVRNVFVALIVAVRIFKITAPNNLIIVPIEVFFLTRVVLVVMHPDFQHTSINPDFIAELLDPIFISLLHLPSNFLCKLVHSLFLALAELRPKSLTRRRTSWWRSIYIYILIQTRDTS